MPKRLLTISKRRFLLLNQVIGSIQYAIPFTNNRLSQQVAAY
jgi:hypothetical protein